MSCNVPYDDTKYSSDNMANAKAYRNETFPHGKVASSKLPGFGAEESTIHSKTMSKFSKLKTARLKFAGAGKSVLKVLGTVAGGLASVAGVAQAAYGAYGVVQAGKNLKSIAKGPYNPLQAAQVASNDDNIIAGITSAVALFFSTIAALPQGFDPAAASHIYETDPVPMQMASMLLPIGDLLGSTVTMEIGLIDTINNML